MKVDLYIDDGKIIHRLILYYFQMNAHFSQKKNYFPLRDKEFKWHCNLQDIQIQFQ